MGTKMEQNTCCISLHLCSHSHLWAWVLGNDRVTASFEPVFCLTIAFVTSCVLLCFVRLFSCLSLITSRALRAFFLCYKFSIVFLGNSCVCKDTVVKTFVYCLERRRLWKLCDCQESIAFLSFLCCEVAKIVKS